MKKNKILINKNQFKTNKILLFSFAIFLSSLPLLLTWILIGDINALQLNYLVGYNSILWTGKVTNENINLLATTYGKFFQGGETELKITLNNWLLETPDKSLSIHSYIMYLNSLPLILGLSFLIFSILYPIIFNVLKISRLDLLPISFCSSTFLFSLLMLGLLPSFLIDLNSLWWIIRIVLSAIFALISFGISSYFVNLFILNNNYANQYAMSIKEEIKENKVYSDELKRSISEYKNNKNDLEFIEISIDESEKK